MIGISGRQKLAKCYDRNFASGSGNSGIKAMTRHSRSIDWKGLNAEKLVNPDAKKQDHIVRNPSIACTMDICTWFATQEATRGWPTITVQRLELCKTDDFKAELRDGQTPVDGIKTFGTTMLHEV